jgi:ankyrin repeat protein
MTIFTETTDVVHDFVPLPTLMEPTSAGLLQRVKAVWEATLRNDVPAAEKVFQDMITVEDTIACLNERDARDHSVVMHMAAARGNTRLLQMFFDRGANVNSRNVFLNTPLHLAVIHKQVNAVRWLMDHGAQVDARNADNLSPALMVAPSDRENSMSIACVRLLEHTKKKKFAKAQLLLLRPSSPNPITA